MTLDALVGRLSPDVPDTLKRFPLAIVLAGLATLVLIGVTTELLAGNEDLWGRTVLGLATGAVFATGGALFAETRRAGSIPGLVVAYLVPIAAVAAWQVTETAYLVPFGLPVIGALWTSVSASTRGWRGPAGRDAEDRFWWLNHLAIASAAIVAIAYLVILVGTFAIGQTVDVLFGANLELPLYRVALPAIGGFFAPLYWLSTLPRVSDYAPSRLESPDFLIRAVATIGKFILIPLLLAYAAILLAYAVQIAVTQRLPEGMLGWMVLGFVITGAAAWLILHPEFLRDSVIVRFFRRWWFWATVVPLALYAVAVWVRLDAYGFTEERLLLVWAGLWAAALTVIFLSGRGDIRLIPILAAICLFGATIGPQNVVNLSRHQQALAFDALLPLSGPNGESYGITPDWTSEEDARARGAVQYLVQTAQGRDAVREILRRKGFDLHDEVFGLYDVMVLLGAPDPGATAGESRWLSRPPGETVDVSATPLYVGNLYVYPATVRVEAMDLGFSVVGDALRVMRGDEVIVDLSLVPLIASARGGTLETPYVDFAVADRPYRLVIETLGLSRSAGAGDTLDHLDGRLFAGPMPPAPPPPATPTTEDPPAPAP